MNYDLPMILASVAGSVILSGVSSWYAFRRHFERFEAKAEVHLQYANQQRDEIKRDIKSLQEGDTLRRELLERTVRAEKDIQDLRDWKHDVADPYVPRAIEEHERRLNKLDSKVFNGPDRGKG
jgi:hypothetical protein